MATTRIWAVKSRADHVLDYVMNPEKTINPGWSKDEYQAICLMSSKRLYSFM